MSCFRLQRNPGSGIYDFPGGGTVFPLHNTVEKALDGFRDTLFIIRFQNIVESFQLESLQRKLAVTGSEDNFTEWFMPMIFVLLPNHS